MRIGINTGEAVVALGARPEQGEGIVTGDVVNTASRLQGAAPVGGIAVGEQTYRATERVFDYEPLEPVAVEGQGGAARALPGAAARGRFGIDVTRTHATPLVGRELEKALLIGTFERAGAAALRASSSRSSASRASARAGWCAELFAYVEEQPELVELAAGPLPALRRGHRLLGARRDRQGRGGILESDSPEEARRSSSARLPADEPERRGCRARLAPLVGVEAGEPAAQEESFTAWRRFLEALAAEPEPCWCSRTCTGPTRRCSRSSSTWPTGRRACRCSSCAPPARSCTSAIPTGRRRSATRRRSTSRRSPTRRRPSSSRLARSSGRLPAETSGRSLERAGGNPLYAEEFVRLLADRGELADGRAEVSCRTRCRR